VEIKAIRNSPVFHTCRLETLETSSERFSSLTIFVVEGYYEVVAGRLQQEIRQTKPIRLLEEEAALNVVRTADVLMQRVGEVLKPHGLSATQYNVLRILRGAGDEGVSSKDVGCRLLARDPDITRLMDRLEKRGLVARDRAREDRRVVTHRLTTEGLALLSELDEPIESANREMMKHISPEKLKTLIAILEEIRIAH
jgi:DNA-binding MarR family transcriptional regulator